MADISFVRTEMLPPKPPPATERGVVKWLRENLFSGWLNSILTVLARAGAVLPGHRQPALAAPMASGTPDRWANAATSSLQSAEASGRLLGDDPVERWHQFIFGFYPPELYWRPTTAFALMFVALAPVLYYGLNRLCAIMVGTVGGACCWWR